jgi:hypothetical protein
VSDNKTSIVLLDKIDKELGSPEVLSDRSFAFTISDYDSAWLFAHLEGGMHTGCIRICSQEKKARSAMLLYRGRVIMCIHESANDLKIDSAMQNILADLALADTVVEIIDMPESTILTMSSNISA